MVLIEKIKSTWNKIDWDMVKKVGLLLLAIGAIGGSLALSFWVMSVFPPLGLIIGGLSSAFVYHQAGNISKFTRNALIAATLFTGLVFSVFFIAPASLSLLTLGGIAPLAAAVGFMGIVPLMLLSTAVLFAGLVSAFQVGEYLYRTYGPGVKSALDGIKIYPASPMGVYYQNITSADQAPQHFPSPLAANQPDTGGQINTESPSHRS